MTELSRKRQLFETEGFSYDFDREVYYNRDSKKVFSVEYIEDHSVDDLAKRISEDGRNGQWYFYFNAEPPDWARRELEDRLG